MTPAKFKPGQIVSNGPYGLFRILAAHLLVTMAHPGGSWWYDVEALEDRYIGPMDPPQRRGEIGRGMEECYRELS